MQSLFSGVNWLAVLLAALAYFALGALWYSKALFANRWLAATKIDAFSPDASKGMAMLMFFSFVLMFITSVGLAILSSRLNLSGWMSGVKLGTMTGLCFGITAISISYLYEKRPAELHFINGGYTLLGNAIAGAIICSWG